MSDINQRLLKRKIAKKKQYLNTKLKTKRNFKKMTEHEGYEMIPLTETEDPMLQKRMNIYKEIFEDDKGEKNESNKILKKHRKAMKESEEAPKQIKTKEEIDRERAKKSKQREKFKRNHMQRTKKGQPVMKNMINALLSKVKKTVQAK